MDKGGEKDNVTGKKRSREEEETRDNKRSYNGFTSLANKGLLPRTPHTDSRHIVNDIVRVSDVSPHTPHTELSINDGPVTTPLTTPGDRTDQAASKGPVRELKFEPENSKVNMVSVDLCDGEYVLEIKKRKISTEERKKPEQMAQSAGMLFVHAEILRELGDQMLAQYRASLPSIFTIKSSAT